MSINRKLGDLANVLDDGTEGQVLSFNASGVIAASDIAAGASVYDSAALLPISGLSAGDMAYVTGTNRFYISNGTGWYSVSLINTNPSITSVQDSAGGTTPFTLTTDGTATVITVTASDPEEVPLTYNYSVTSGSLTNGGGTTATVTQADNVFTVTPSTTEAYAGTFELTFTASDGINQDTSANSFTLEFITTITNSKYTTLLATATGTSDNNNITDASTNNHSITVNGDTHAGTFSPYRSGGYSTYFDGTTNTYLNVSSSSGGVAIGSGDFTISFWVYSDDVTSNNNYLLDYRPLNFNTGNHPVIYIQTDGTFRYKIAGTEVIVGNTAISSKQWAYFCLARDNGTTKMYVNGILQAATYSGTEILTNGSNRPVIGTGAYNISPMFNGYISDLRVVTSLDTTAYSVPIERMSAINNTQLLTCHLPYIADGSTNSHSITVNGNVSTKPFSPYDYNEYSAADHGGSVYFDGSGDYLTAPASANWNFGTGNFTIEFWAYRKNILDSTYHDIVIAGREGSYTTGKWAVGIQPNSELYFSARAISGDILLNGGNAAENAWNHIAIVRNGNLFTGYINGISVDTHTASDSIGLSTQKLSVGAFGDGNFPWDGYIADLRIEKGLARYTATDESANIPTAPLSSSGAELHIKGTDASIIDKSQGSNLKLVGNTTGSTTQVKFANTKSMYFDGTGDHVEVNHEALGTGNWTIDGWVYFNSTPTTYVFDFRSGAATNPALAIQDGDWRYITNSAYRITSGVNPSINTWYHFALVKYNGTTTLYVDGSSIGTYADSLNYLGTSAGQIGKYNINTSSNLNGYLQDFRISKGLARYTANFTPPTASLEG